jgi:hypothetical protein
MRTVPDRALFSPVPARTAGRPHHPRLVGGATLVAGVLAGAGLGTLPAGAASIQRSAAAITAPGTIFVANAGGGDGAGGTGNGSVTVYPPGATGNARPEVVITTGVNGPGDVIFDSSGNLWVSNGSSGTVAEYSKAELSKASPVPTVTISPSTGTGGIALWPSGDLWVGSNNGVVVEYSKAQLGHSGSPAPKVTIDVADQCSLAFDRSGDLWVGNMGPSLSELAKAQLARSGSPAPRVTISSASLDWPCRPAFDSAGDLWAANYNGNTVVEFTKAELAKSGSSAPRVTVTPRPFLSDPGDVSFDLTGDLWLTDPGHESVVELTKAQLAKSGSQAPAKAIAGPATGLNWPWSIAIEP